MTRQWVLALTGLAAEGRVVQRVNRQGDGVRRVTDVVELMAVAQPAICDAVLVSARFPQMSRDVAFRLAADGLRVWGVVDPGDDVGRRILADWGVAVLEAGPDLDLTGRLTAGEPPSPKSEPRGVLIAVVGSPGAPGRSTVALNLAAEWGPGALLVDGDAAAPSLGFTLGLPGGSPGVAGLARAAGAGRLEPGTLFGAAHLVGGVRILPGSPTHVAPGSADAVMDLCTRGAGVTVVDCGPTGVGEWGVAAVQRASIVVCVAEPSPLGVRRWVEGVSGLRSAAAGRMTIVWNQVRSDRSARATGQVGLPELARLTGDVLPGVPVAGLPWEPRAFVRGPVLSSSAPRSGLRAGIARLAGLLVERCEQAPVGEFV